MRNVKIFSLSEEGICIPPALEGALKLKEISYINANGYPAGEFKHGPIALINENSPTVALTANKATRDKMLSNLQEVKARGEVVIAIVERRHGPPPTKSQ